MYIICYRYQVCILESVCILENNERRRILPTLFSLERFAHAKCDTAFVECLVSSYCHSDLVSHSEEQQTTLSAGNGYLSDQLIKTLTEWELLILLIK